MSLNGLDKESEWGTRLKFLAHIPAWLWILIIIIYILFPMDLIPEFFGPAGILDDLLIALGLFYYLRSLSKKKLQAGPADEAGRRYDPGRSDQHQHYSNKEAPSTDDKKVMDPYEIIGVSRDRPFEEIQKKYKEQVLKYHPDRTQHLGKELQELAEKKTKDLNEAFQRIRAERRRKGTT